MSPHRKAVIGSSANQWLHHTATGFDLTHSSPNSSDAESKTRVTSPRTIQTTTCPIAIAPSKSALVIIDMQNFFLSPGFGRKPGGAGHVACEKLVNFAIPAARKAGMRIVWCNWGLTEEDLEVMPPAVKRAFGFLAVPEWSQDDDVPSDGVGVDRFGNVRDGGETAMYTGLGLECGAVQLETGEKIDAGRLLMRDTWNAALYPPLDGMYEAGAESPHNPDVWMHKNRMSGLWGASTPLEEFLKKERITTLFFAGVNTDQCVGGTLTDAFSKGYDCILLGDGCGTSSPEFAQKSYEFNTARTYGFCTDCKSFANGLGAGTHRG